MFKVDFKELDYNKENFDHDDYRQAVNDTCEIVFGMELEDIIGDWDSWNYWDGENTVFEALAEEVAENIHHVPYMRDTLIEAADNQLKQALLEYCGLEGAA
jgi:hypothetical protein